MGLKNRKLLYSSNGRPSVLNSNQANFSRFGVASSNKSHVDDYGSMASPTASRTETPWPGLTCARSATRKSAHLPTTWSRKSEEGPFLNMSDFINRRLQSGEMGVKGGRSGGHRRKLDQQDLDELTDMVITPKVGYPKRGCGQGLGLYGGTRLPDPVGRACGAGQHSHHARRHVYNPRLRGSDEPGGWCFPVRGARRWCSVGSTSGPGEQSGDGGDEGEHEDRSAGRYGFECGEQGVWPPVQHCFLPLALP